MYKPWFLDEEVVWLLGIMEFVLMGLLFKQLREIMDERGLRVLVWLHRLDSGIMW